MKTKTSTIKAKFIPFAILMMAFGFNVVTKAQNVGIGATSFTPDVAAMLEITSPTGAANAKGILIPRVTYADRPSTVGAGSNGLLIYQTDDNVGTGEVHGFYYWDNTIPSWLPFLSSSAASSSAGWLVKGNLGTSAATDYCGTKDAVDFRIGTNATERLRVLSTGNVGIGLTAPTGILETYASGVKTAAYTGNILGNYATNTTTNAIDKVGLEVISTGTWNGGATATNTGLYIGSVSGGSKNYDAVFNGGNPVGIGVEYPKSRLHIENTNALDGQASLRIIEKGAVSGGATYGIYDSTSGASEYNYGLYVIEDNGVTLNYGAYIKTNATGAIGVYGISSGSYHAAGAGTNTGVSGQATNPTGAGKAIGVNGNATGAGTQNIGGSFTASSATTCIGGYFSATSGTNNYAISVPSNAGYVGIGLNAPSYLVDVYAQSLGGSATRSTRTLNLQQACGSASVHYGIYNAITNGTNAGIFAQYDSVSSGTANQNVYGNYIVASSTSAGTGSIIGLSSRVNSGSANTNHIAGHFIASGGTNNYAIITGGGNVGIGNTAPGSLLTVGKAGTTLGVLRLEGSTSGYTIVQPNVAAGSWTMTLPGSAGTSGYALTTDGSGTTSWSPAHTIVVLGSDVTNNNGTANTIANVTGLSFSVTSGTTYRFRATIIYTAAATTTGSRWSINGPAAPTLLSYTSKYGITATTETVNYANAYNIPAASNASSPYTTSNMAIIDGIITPSANGTLIVRFASEVSGSAIVAKAGSTLEYW